jgi:hypothetical protein
MNREEMVAADRSRKTWALTELAKTVERDQTELESWAVKVPGTGLLFKFYTEDAAREFLATKPGSALQVKGPECWLDYDALPFPEVEPPRYVEPEPTQEG